MTEWACSAAVQLQPVSGSTWKRLDPYFSSMFLLYSPGSVILLLHPIIASQAWIFLYTQGFMCRFVVNLGSGLRCCSPHVTETYVWFVVSKKKKKNSATFIQQPQDVINYLCVTYITNKGSVLSSVPVCCCAWNLEIESAKWNFRQNSFYHLDLCLFFFFCDTRGRGEKNYYQTFCDSGFRWRPSTPTQVLSLIVVGLTSALSWRWTERRRDRYDVT